MGVKKNAKQVVCYNPGDETGVLDLEDRKGSEDLQSGYLLC